MVGHAYIFFHFGFVGVFDGTVGDTASHFVQNNILQYFVTSKGFQELRQAEREGEELPLEKVAAYLHSAFHETYSTTDSALLSLCEQRSEHYAASTCVTLFIRENLLSVAHVADSKACLARLSPDKESIVVEWLTRDHKV